MRILHTSDIHLGELTGPVEAGENLRMQDTINCMNHVAGQAREEQVDAILIAGDLFHKSKLWADQMLKEIAVAADWLRELARTAPTVLMFGTRNHDNMEAFENLRAMRIPNLHIITTPQIITLQTYSGPLQVAAVPGFDKGYFRARYPGMAAEEENAVCSQMLGDIVLGLGAQVDTSTPSVLMSHYTVVGCQLDNGEHVFMQNEVVLPKEALAASPFDLVCLGHIHRHQEVRGCGRPTFYSGSINRLSFNEEGQFKGFFIHNIEPMPQCALEAKGESCEICDPPDGQCGGIKSRFIETPARWFTTIQVMKDEEYDWPVLFADNPREAMELYAREIDPCKDAVTRFHYICDEETRKRLDHKVIERALYDAGAFYVSEIKPVQVVTSLVKQEMTENDGPLENLVTWAGKEGLQAEIDALVALARPLVNTVSAKMPTGKLSGVFVPRKIEVKNYRSYREEAFDFSPISFATVNGPNGVGKSALFMDALVDCLYEETREGDLAGWISSDIKARSGSITFEFDMGGVTWKVIRTRAKSGKVTLALQELVDGQWTDRSGDKVKDTQEKVVALLGMDAMTFKCCGLIMQDAYGLFLEADRSDRMEVLGSILGLGVYEQLEKLAKEKVTETNRALAAAKEKLAELDAKLKVKPTLKSDLAAVNAELLRVKADIEAKEAELKDAEDLARDLAVKAARVNELKDQVRTIQEGIKSLEDEVRAQEKQRDKAWEIIARENEINAMAEKYEQARRKVAVLQSKKPRLAELAAEEDRINQEIGKVGAQSVRLIPQIKEIEDLLQNREALEQAVVEYREAVSALEGLDAKSNKYNGLLFKRREIENPIDEKKTEWYALQSELKSLQKKALMLEDTGCIDADKASCRFLADAVESKGKMPALETRISALVSEIAPLDKQAAQLTAQIDGMGYDPHEHRRLRDQVTELRDKAEQAAQLSAKDELLKNLLGQKRQAHDQIDRLNEQLENVRTAAKALAEELKPLTVLEASLPNLEKWAKAKEQIPAARQLVATATERVIALDKDITSREEQVKELERQRHLLQIETANLPATKANIENYRGHIKVLQEQQNGLHAKAGGIKAQLEALGMDEEQRRQLVAEMEPAAVRLIRCQTLVRAFGQDGIPFSIVRAVVPELSAMANDILGQMTGGKMALQMKTERIQKSNKREVNALEIWIDDYQRGSLPYKSRSGGQKVKAALSVAFALADLKARRAGIQLGMLFIDEPPFLDGEGTEAYCDALELVSQRYPNMKVLAISHDPRMKARFPQEIDVEDRGEEGSRIKLIA